MNKLVEKLAKLEFNEIQIYEHLLTIWATLVWRCELHWKLNLRNQNLTINTLTANQIEP